uniref:ShKT domain-containing protein n=1 Tax=Corethron hystrix TaxID=216773 RepID=A0A6U5HVA9_9STRA|mmetsp:Transcript_31722/g.72802  ORF Transcript_31722/g.72802 Transcript_31722/m.72802 type:complete len:123 (+) Transcript_31722:972-1340(+)
MTGCFGSAGAGPTAAPVAVPPTDAPTDAAPRPMAAPKPTAAPTAAPVRPVPTCKDDKKFKSPPVLVGGNVKRKKCKFFKKLKDDEERNRFCSDYEEIREGCPKTCDACAGRYKNNKKFVHET